ncbi:MAG: hypothetical protein MOB07_16125 [Acidobacteria bacterium]|nr:hypothetical protein [Acidobacteriota bacterium]
MDVRERVRKIKQVVEEQRRLYAGDPNVHSIGWGAPIRKGKLYDEVAIKFFVREKLADADAIQAIGSRPIPKEIDGFPTDVEAGKLRRAASSATGERDEKIRDPLVCGVASSNAAAHIFVGNSYGTLGMLCRDSEGRAMGISNWHVWADGGEDGDNIIQPAHPIDVDHVLSVFETLACGSILGAVVNTNVPSPLSAGLLAGAAAVGVAAAASDHIDPTRRGQEATPVPAGVTTQFEEVEMAIEYPELPWPGTPFHARANWTYFRHTSSGILTHEVSEERINPHFLIGHLVVSDRPSYEASETATVRAVIWDHKPRPCDSYHVAIHLIPDKAPTRAVRQVLKPAACAGPLGRLFPTGGDLCIRFNSLVETTVQQRASQIEWLSVMSLGPAPIVIRGAAGGGGPALVVPGDGMRFRFHPATNVAVRLARGSNPATLRAFDPFRNEVASVTSAPGARPALTVSAPLITSVELRPESGRAMVQEFCINPINSDSFSVPIDPALGRQLLDEGSSVACTTDAFGNEICVLNVRRCCFERSYEISSLEPPDHWRGYLTVQNVNTVGEGTDPILAARTIGGHVLTPSVFIIGCAVFHAADAEYDST